MSTAAGATRVVEACRVEAVRLGHWPCEQWHKGDPYMPVHCMTCRDPWPCAEAAPAPTSLLYRLTDLLGDEAMALGVLRTIETWSTECSRCGEHHDRVDPLGWPLDMARHGAHMEQRPHLAPWRITKAAREGGYR